ncbi:MAG: rfbF, partial [Gemmatimonadetes bacterium]|nr:rfbF [Gemmatimonadota bacterium]
PKPMVEIGGMPLIWHLMGIYAAHGLNDFVVACGHKGALIKEFFHNFATHYGDFAVDLNTGAIRFLNPPRINWCVEVMDTGQDTMTGGRLLRLQPLLAGKTFMATYGDGLANVDVKALLAFHRAHGKLATVTAVRPPARFGDLTISGDAVRVFAEKPQAHEGWINGGFFVFEPGIFDYIAGDDVSLEHDPLERLASEGQLMAYKHHGFWQPMDTLREKMLLEELWASGNPPWKHFE